MDNIFKFQHISHISPTPIDFKVRWFPIDRQGAKGFAPGASQAVLGVEERQRLQRQLLQPAEGDRRSAEAVVEVATCHKRPENPWKIRGKIRKSRFLMEKMWGKQPKKPKVWMVHNHHDVFVPMKVDVGTIFGRAIEF